MWRSTKKFKIKLDNSFILTQSRRCQVLIYCWHRYTNMGWVFWQYYDCCFQHAALLREILYYKDNCKFPTYNSMSKTPEPFLSVYSTQTVTNQAKWVFRRNIRTIIWVWNWQYFFSFCNVFSSLSFIRILILLLKKISLIYCTRSIRKKSQCPLISPRRHNHMQTRKKNLETHKIINCALKF